MYVRLAFAVAAHLDSDILIADEVLAVGDAEFQKKAIGKMSELSTGQGRTVLFVSHNMAAVKSLCNKGVILEKGRLKFQSDSIDEAINVYLGINDKLSLSSTWENDGLVNNHYFTPEKVSITDDEGAIMHGTLCYDATYKVRLDAYISEIIPNIDFWILIYQKDEYIFALKGPNNKLHTGKNSFEFDIYPQMLPPGKYQISLSVSIKNTRWIIDPDEFIASIPFSVVSNKTDMWQGKQLS